MTNREAIERIKDHIEVHHIKEDRAVKIVQALNMAIEALERTEWHYPSKGEIPDKDWSKHPQNISKECFVVTKRGIGTIARWDNDYRMWFERPRLAVIDVIAWQYFETPKEEA